MRKYSLLIVGLLMSVAVVEAQIQEGPSDSLRLSSIKPSQQLGDGVDTLKGATVVSMPVASSPEKSEKSEAMVDLAAEQSKQKTDRFLPMRRRFDREVNKNKFVYKGEVLVGLTASYGTLSSEDSDLYLFLDQINVKGTMATVKPYVGFAYRDNQVIGVRFGYQHIRGDLGNLGVNLGEQNDLSFSLSDVGYDNDSYSFGLYHRSYVGLDQRGRFGLFADIEALVMTGSSTFQFGSGEERKYADSRNFKAELSFNPGLAVYIFPNVCGTLSFGLGGLKYAKITQQNEQGEEVGYRESSKLRFRLNLAEINIGFTVHLWNKKKK